MNFLNSSGLFLKVFLILIVPVRIYAQTYPVTITGEILDQTGIGVTYCTIKLHNTNNHIIYSYFNTGDKNIFEAALLIPVNDTIAITVSHIGYSDVFLKVVSNKENRTFRLNIILKAKVQTLSDALVQVPPVWRRGDTTFFKADSFKEGDERKLKDLLVKIPGFEITQDGKLLYKKKPVEKIMLDGEDLFSDKIRLMLNNFPIHVIYSIQAIENQNGNKLLHGIADGGLVFLNLGLNKARVKAAFGEGEAGVGTGGKYAVNPVLFSIAGRLKTGFIGNWNSIGNGIGWHQENELKKEPQEMAQHWMMGRAFLQTIPDFESRWYINNNQWDNRLQMNLPINKNIKSQTELNFISDRQAQNSYFGSSIYNGLSYIPRKDTNVNNDHPIFLNVKESVQLLLDSSREIKTTFTYFRDLSAGRQYVINFQDTSKETIQNLVFNNWESFTAGVDYTHRISASKATQYFTQINYQRQGQHASAISPQWPLIFNQTNPDYTFFTQNIDNHIFFFKGGGQQFNKAKRGALEVGFSYDLISANLQNGSYLSDSYGNLPKLMPAAFNNHGLYNINKLSGNIQRSINVSSSKVFILSLHYGYSRVSACENAVAYSFINPEYFIDASYLHKLGKNISSNIAASFIQKQAEPYQLYQFLRPLSVSNFNENANIKLPVRAGNINYSLSWPWPNNFSSGDIGFYYSRSFSGFAPVAQLNNFIQLEKDSVLKSQTSYWNISTSQLLPSVFFMALIQLKAGFGRGTFLLVQKGQLLAGRSTNSFLSISFKRNWNRKYFLNLLSDFTWSNYLVPQQITGSISPNVFNLKNTFIQRLMITDQMNLVISTSFFNNNLFTPESRSFLFSDVEYNIKFKKSPFSFAVSGGNLTNTKYYYYSSNNSLSQSFFTIPLTERRLFVSVRYEL